MERAELADSLASALNRFDEESTRQRQRDLGLVFGWGVGLAVSGSAGYNWLHWAVASARSPRGVVPPFAWDFGYELDLATSVAIVVGLCAVVATLSVAVVASTWRPDGLLPDVERPIESWSSIMRRAMCLAATFSFTSAILTTHTSYVAASALLGVSVITSMVAIATVERRGELSTMVERHSLVEAADGAELREREDFEARPAIALDMSRTRACWCWVATALIPAAASAAMLAAVLFAWISGSEAPSTAEFLASLGSWLAVSTFTWVFQFLALVIFAGGRSNREAVDARLGWPHRCLVGFCVVLSAVLPLTFLVNQPSGIQRFLCAVAFLAPSLVTLAVTWMGWDGQFPGVVMFAARHRRLAREKRRAGARLAVFDARQALRDQLRLSIVGDGQQG